MIGLYYYFFYEMMYYYEQKDDRSRYGADNGVRRSGMSHGGCGSDVNVTDIALVASQYQGNQGACMT